ncbi:helix-turn-helix domain-containing protein [Sulfurisphaera ohwakuensis]|uniref:DNA-binding transcriptional ArsR family regulator n=1 Tax=Sulfurisphaera ohwakuensis TaxID=69656 RepID=A0A650CGA4_SULOH|nr:helix-turn-helix domain-containing protein [Sulfurisphaera ohwakuensis]MBB5252645.1 DNA-binding transcriptional ArsR family regulator [Sulfurisphaera ohwakuensis]QGR16921.1 helix-turn-helix domain-containing protein [Sulfurisphaera ohwakuensis]
MVIETYNLIDISFIFSFLNSRVSLPEFILYSDFTYIELAVSPLLAVSLLLIIIRYRRNKIEISYDKIDKRDIMVLEAIKRGYKTLTEISSFTGLPKSTTYRRLKKLTDLGYLVCNREYGKVYYEINRPSRRKIIKTKDIELNEEERNEK